MTIDQGFFKNLKYNNSNFMIRTEKFLLNHHFSDKESISFF